MKVFVAGAKAITKLAPAVQERLSSICDKGYCVIVGDCAGIDTEVQRFYAGIGYRNVTVYACNGKARNNVGNNEIKTVLVRPGISGFEYYQQKDIAMASDADFGYMIWNCKSRGTLCNIIELVKQGKQTVVYLDNLDLTLLLKSPQDLDTMLTQYAPEMRKVFYKAFYPQTETAQTKLSS